MSGVHGHRGKANLLLLAETPAADLRPGLQLGADWQGSTGHQAQWCWPSHPEVPAALGSASLRHVPAGSTPGAAVWLALCAALVADELPLLVRLGCPGVGLAQLQQLHALLVHSDAVFGVTPEGDYAAVGLACAVPELFAGIPWGTNRVMSTTRVQARRCGCRISELALPTAVASD